MKRLFKQSSILVVVLMLVLSTGAFAASNNLFDTVKTRLLSIADNFTSKNSALVADGDRVTEQLAQDINTIEADIKNRVSEYEQAQIKAAKAELQAKANELKTEIEKEKAAIEADIKDKVQEKIQKDLEQEFKKLEKALEKK